MEAAAESGSFKPEVDLELIVAGVSISCRNFRKAVDAPPNRGNRGAIEPKTTHAVMTIVSEVSSVMMMMMMIGL